MCSSWSTETSLSACSTDAVTLSSVTIVMISSSSLLTEESTEFVSLKEFTSAWSGSLLVTGNVTGLCVIWWEDSVSTWHATDDTLYSLVFESVTSSTWHALLLTFFLSLNYNIKMIAITSMYTLLVLSFCGVQIFMAFVAFLSTKFTKFYMCVKVIRLCHKNRNPQMLLAFHTTKF